MSLKTLKATVDTRCFNEQELCMLLNGGYKICTFYNSGKKHGLFLISNFRRVLYIVYFLLGKFRASEFYMPTFRSTLSVPSL
jgi:hypothetical protein